VTKQERQRIASKKYYKSHKGKVAKKKALELQKKKSRIVRWARHVEGCCDCGYRGNPAALHYDHVKGTKKFGFLSYSRSWESILDEMAKCEVRCANCHISRHHPWPTSTAAQP